MTKYRNALLVGLLIVSAVLGVVLASVGVVVWYTHTLYPFLNAPFADRRFDRQLWLAQHESTDPDNPRGQMADDLRQRHLSPGMARERVLELLGEPDFEKTPAVFKYNLGAWSGFRIDYDSLDVHFDGTGRLTETRVVQH